MVIKNTKILLVEDNRDHLEMIQMVLSNEKLVNTIYSVTNGEEALDYLFRHGAYADKAQSPRPSLILLDIKLPRISGLEVLRQIKSDARLKSIPVVLLTTSTEKNEIIQGYEYGANSYVIKPLRFEELMYRVETIYNYWTMTNQLPVIENNGYPG